MRESNSSNTSDHKAVNSSEKVPDILGGGIPAEINVPRSRGIQRSAIALSERYAKTSE